MDMQLAGNTAAAEEIRAILESITAALKVKDIDALMEHYGSETQIFDLDQQVEGKAKYHTIWAACLPYFGDEILLERGRVTIQASPDLAFVHGYSLYHGSKTDDPAAHSWCRITMCFQKQNGRWQIMHEHFSMPIDFEAGAPALIQELP